MLFVALLMALTYIGAYCLTIVVSRRLHPPAAKAGRAGMTPSLHGRYQDAAGIVATRRSFGDVRTSTEAIALPRNRPGDANKRVGYDSAEVLVPRRSASA